MNNGWIIESFIEDLRNRIKALEDLTEAHPIYKMAKQDEITFLEYELEEIEQMLLEEVTESELADEDYRENRAYSQI